MSAGHSIARRYHSYITFIVTRAIRYLRQHDTAASYEIMPLVDSVMRSSAQQWQRALENAKKQRLDPSQVPFKELASQFHASLEEVADILIRLHSDNGDFVDPLVLRYIDHALRARYTNSTSIMLAMLERSRFAKATPMTTRMSSGLPSLEEQVFALLRSLLVTARFSAAICKPDGVVFAITLWLHVARKANEHEVGKQLDSGVMHAGDGPATGVFEALGLLAITVFGHRSFPDIEKQPWWKTRRSQIASEMEQYDMHVLQWIQSQYTGHLQNLTKGRPFLELDANGLPKFTDQQILAAVPEVPVVNTRAGLFVWLSGCLCARPLTDDATVRNHLLVRYQDNAQTAAVDLIVAAFDVLTNAALCKESRPVIKSIRSFICNKMLILLRTLVGFNGPGAVDGCVQMAMMAVSVDPLTPLSTGATDVRDMLKKVRLEFLTACTLQGLISESTVGSVLQEQSITLLKESKYTREGLLAQCAHNSSRLESIIHELDAMHGNAGAISTCVVDTVNSLCASKDTMSLKAVCNALLRKVTNLDIIMQYAQPTNLLLPLCNVLNDWVHDQDQSEFQPPYEEFACILLFLLAAIHRYKLSTTELGLAQEENFVVKLLKNTSQSMQMSELPEEQQQQLAKWIEGLYATDEHGDTTGIGDEVMSHCPPQAFYSLVPTLFEQSVLACKMNALSVDTAKGGLEFLLEPFLLPSLVGGITWLVKHSWEDQDDADILLQILDKLLKPSSTAQETQIMHRAILGIVADPLEKSLRELVRRRPDRQREASALADLLKPYLCQQRTIMSNKAEADTFVAEGSIAKGVRNVIRDLTLWATAAGSEPPPRYTHRIFHAAARTIGLDAVLQAVIHEVKDQAAFGNASIVLDIATALVCTPEPSTYVPLMNIRNSTASRTSFTLRDMVRLRTSDVQSLQKLPVEDAESLVRLARRIEAQSAVSQVALASLPTAPVDQAVADQVMKDLGLSEEDANAVADSTILGATNALGQDNGTNFSAVDFVATGDPSLDLSNSAQLDLSSMMGDSNMMQMDQPDNAFTDLGIDFGQSGATGGDDGANQAGTEQQTAEDDIFAGLDLGQDFDFP